MCLCDALRVMPWVCYLCAWPCLPALVTGFLREAAQGPGARPWLSQSALLPSFGEKKNGPLSYQALCLHSAALPPSPCCLFPLWLSRSTSSSLSFFLSTCSSHFFLYWLRFFSFFPYFRCLFFYLFLIYLLFSPWF